MPMTSYLLATHISNRAPTAREFLSPAQRAGSTMPIDFLRLVGPANAIEPLRALSAAIQAAGFAAQTTQACGLGSRRDGPLGLRAAFVILFSALRAALL